MKLPKAVEILTADTVCFGNPAHGRIETEIISSNCMSEPTNSIDLQIDHPAVDDLHQAFQPDSLRAHVLSLIHRFPYENLASSASGKSVLELGCNKGFGTVIYADKAASVKAVDTSAPAIDQARELNARDNVEYICLDSWTLPFDDDSFDITVLFQVIEHIALDKLDIFLREIKRVTKGEGQVIFTTPNRHIRLLPFQKPWNEFHTREYSAGDLHDLLSPYFPELRVEGLFGVDALNEVELKRVGQKRKISKVYIKQPLRKHLVHPLRRWLSGDSEPAQHPEPAKNSNKSVKESSVNYPFSLADLSLRQDSLRKALDLCATVTRVK